MSDSTYIHPMLVHVDPLWNLPDTWPEQEFIDNNDIGFKPNPKAAWRLDVCADGTLSLRKKSQKPFNGAALPVYWHDEREILETVQQVTCRLGKPGSEDKRLTHEGGQRWTFSWIPITYTLWQIDAIQRVIHMFLSPDFTREQVYEERQRLTRLVAEATLKVEAQQEA